MRARQLWECGTPLADAWRSTTECASDGRAQSAMEAMATFAEQHSGGGFKAIIDVAMVGLSAAQSGREREAAKKDELLTDVFNQQLIATGFREHPSIGSAPVEISSEHFECGEADWKRSRFAANGRIWNRVRISIPLISRSNSKPSSADRIREAINFLSDSEQDFCSIERKVAAERVRQKIGIDAVRGNGLSDANIIKLIVEKCGTRAIS